MKLPHILWLALLDDQKFKGSHAGHICRVAFAPNVIRLSDDKEGVMRDDIFEMRKDPAGKAEADKLLAGRGSSTPSLPDACSRSDRPRCGGRESNLLADRKPKRAWLTGREGSGSS